jgi:hypothetical protein
MDEINQPIIVDMTYVGIYTKDCLLQVAHGTQTLATLKRQLSIWGNVPHDSVFSRHEAISILERQEGIEMSTEELNADIAEYQIAIQNIECEPDAYVQPSLARSWYEQQIERLQELIQQGESN